MIRHLYRLVDLESGKEYIGSTDHLKSRLNAYRWPSSKRKSILFDRLREVGLHGFRFEVLCTGSENYIRDLESSAIKRFDTISPNGFNMVESTYGGRVFGRRVPYNGRSISYEGIIYMDIYELASLTGLSIHSIRGHCNRQSRGFKWQ